MRRQATKPREYAENGGHEYACVLSAFSDDCEVVRVPYEHLENQFKIDGVEMIRQYLADLKSGERVKHNGSNDTEMNLIEARAKIVIEILTAESLDRLRLNIQLRNLFSRVVINYETGNLEFDWKCGGTTVMPYKQMKSTVH